MLDEDGRALVAAGVYPFPLEKSLYRAHRWSLFRKQPWKFLNLVLYVMSRKYSRRKSWFEDRACLRDAISLAGVLREAGVDHIHSPWADYCAWVALLASRLLDIPFSLQARAYDLHRTSHLYWNAGPEVFANADFVITNSQYNRAYLAPRVRNGRADSLHQIYNGIDLTKFGLGKRDWTLANPIRLLSVARLIEPKGLTYLIEACRRLAEAGHRLRCEIIGGPEPDLYPEYPETLQKAIEQSGMEGSIILSGAQPFEYILDAHRKADVFVLPCVEAKDGHRDITPNALIEAMAMSVPVVSTKMTAIPEIVEDGVSGVLVPPGDARALADAISTLIREPRLRQALGQNARRRIEERFDARKNIRSYVRLFTPNEVTQPSVEYTSAVPG
jgi:glycosyltransferase involved in cell wall biosynthesis